MFHGFYQKCQLSFAQEANRLIYTIRSIRYVGKLFSEEWYVRYDVKAVLGILGMAGRALGDIFGKLLYFALLICAPPLVLKNVPGWGNEETARMVCVSFFFMNCMLGSFFQSHITSKGDESDYLFLNLMQIDLREYYLGEILREYGCQLLYYILFFRIFLHNILHQWSSGIWGLMLVYAGFRFIGEAARLRLNVRYGMPFSERCGKAVYRWYICYVVLMVLLAYGGYPLLWFAGKYGGLPVEEWLGSHVLLCFAAVFFLAVSAGTVAAVRFLWSYPDYQLVARRFCNLNIINDAAEAAQAVQEAGYRLQEDEVKEKELHSRMFEEKKGYDYLNAIFFYRHKRLVRDVVRIKSVIAGVVLGVAAVSLVILRFFVLEAEVFTAQSGEIWEGINAAMPLLVFLMYMASSGQNLTKALFYNCDIALLKYGYYRTPEAILKSFRIRLRYMLRSEILTVGMLCAGIFVNGMLLGPSGHWAQLISMMLCVCTLTVFFSVVFLCMYYIFQPFTEGGSQTGAGYKFCSGALYMVAYLCLQIHTAPTYFAALVFGVTITILGAGYLLVQRLAPSRFHLR